jgi:hypothetical protein
MYQTLKTQLNKFDEELKHKFNDCAAHDEGLYCCLDVEHPRNAKIKSFIRSTTIALIEKEVERLEGSKKEIDYTTYCACDGECFGGCIKSYNNALQDQISYLQSQLKLIQEDNG